MSNLSIYEAFSTTPSEAKKTIKGGRISGFTDINPMYRIKRLTEQFGPCGIGWYYTCDRKWTEQVGEELLCFVDISLYVKNGEDWSMPIHGTGGSMLLTKESKGLRASDEGYKMATTDAISVACKQLGIGADVYWEAGESKYSQTPVAEKQSDSPEKAEIAARFKRIQTLCDHHKVSMETFGAILKELQNENKVSKLHTSKMSVEDFNAMISLVDDALTKTTRDSA